MRRSLALLGISCSLLLAQPRGRAQTADALSFFKNYFITGDYVVGGVGLRGLGGNSGTPGIARGSIAISGVPADAEIVAAFLYWQVVSKDGPNTGMIGAKFDGYPLSSSSGPLAKVLVSAGTAACWSSGGATGSSGGTTRTYSYRVDALRFLPVDQHGNFVANTSHTVEIPDSGSSGNGVPIALGASLVIVYRDPSLPLNAIVVYDGGYTMDQSHDSMTQTIRGFYEASTPAAKMTHIVGSGQANKSERLLVPGLNPIVNPFTGSLGQNWDNPTYSISLATPAEPASTSVDHAGFSSFDCLTWSAVIARVSVKDTDGDGLLDVWEDASTPVLDPNGQPLPNLRAMGADKNVKDLFVELGYMYAADGTTYGGVPKPAHTHLIAKEALDAMGDAFLNAPVPTRVHFDVGPNYQTSPPDPYIIPAGLARGGEAIDEMVTVCTRGAGDPPWVCQFGNSQDALGNTINSAYPGTVGWKTGFKFLRDQFVNTPPPLTATGDDPCDAPGGDGPGQPCERRFDRNRKDIFHYVLGAHFIGLPRAECLKDDGTADEACQQNNPDFHVPRTNSGVDDFPGGDGMVALGGFVDVAGKPTGTPFMQGATLMHEVGHALELSHAGSPVPGAPREPNCKPNYLSVMNYLFQLRGLYTDTEPGVPHMDYSREVINGIDQDGIDENALTDVAWATAGVPRYHTGWYAPQSANTFGTPATKHCDGSPLLRDQVGNLIEPPMVRVDSPTTPGPFDWNLDGSLSGLTAQDLNFDGTLGHLNRAPNDWATFRLNQIGSRRNVGAFFVDAAGNLILGPLSLDVGRGDIGRGDIGRGDIGRGDIGRGDIGRGDIGRGDIGRGDIGRGDIGRGDIGDAAVEVDSEIAASSGFAPPNAVRACAIGIGGCTAPNGGFFHRIRIDWKAPNLGTVSRYFVFRYRSDDPVQTRTFVGTVDAVVGAVDYFLVDTTELPNASFTYFTVAEFVDDDNNPQTPAPRSDRSNLAAVLAVNDAPVAVNDSYSVDEGSTLNIAALGVLANDTDIDSATLTAKLASPPSHGTLTLNANGSFSYTPAAGFAGSDTFTYTANDVDPGRGSNVASVSIAVNDRTPPLVTLTIPAPNGQAGYFVTKPVVATVSAADPSNVASFSCLDNGSAIAIGNQAGIGTSSATGTVAVTAEGTNNLVCTAADGRGNSGAAPGSSNSGSAKIDTVPPAVTIAAPADGMSYLLNATVAASYSCSDPVPGSGVASCTGPVASGTKFDTTTVGPKTLTVTSKDQAGNAASRIVNYSVTYAMTMTPLKTPAQLGSAVPITWQLKDALGNPISALSTLLKMESVFNGQPTGAQCVASAVGTRETLYSVPSGATGNSSFRFVQSDQTYKFNWDSTTASTAPIVTGKGCYTVLVYLDDQLGPKLTTPVQLK